MTEKVAYFAGKEGCGNACFEVQVSSKYGTLEMVNGSPQVAHARYMSSSMFTFALLRNSSDLHIYKDLYGERNKPEKNYR